MPAPTPVFVTKVQERQLKEIVRASGNFPREALRAQIILGLASGKRAQEVAVELSTSMPSVSKWRKRWSKAGLAGLGDATGRGRKPSIPAETVEEVMRLSPAHSHHGAFSSLREIATLTGLSKSTIQRLWAMQGTNPDRLLKIQSESLSQGQNLWDIVGLYLAPPKNAVALCCERRNRSESCDGRNAQETSRQADALTRGSHLMGQTMLFAALAYLTDKVLAHAASKNFNAGWMAFLRQINTTVGSQKEIHIICNHEAATGAPRIKAWFARNKRFRLHISPSDLWLSQVEHFFEEITDDFPLSESFRNVSQLATNIFQFLNQHKLDPSRYQWIASQQTILERIAQAWENLEPNVHRPDLGAI